MFWLAFRRIKKVFYADNDVGRVENKKRASVSTSLRNERTTSDNGMQEDSSGSDSGKKVLLKNDEGM